MATSTSGRRRGFVFAGLTRGALAVEDAPMHAAVGRRACGAVLGVMTLLGCRGEARQAAGSGAAGSGAPADDKLAWPAVDEPSLIAWVTTDGFARGAPEPLAITPDGAVLFRRTKPRDATG